MPPITYHDAYSDDGSRCLAVTPDMAEEVDELADELMEFFAKLKIERPLAQAIAKWHQAMLAQESERQQAFALSRVIGYLLRPGNTLVRAHAVAHAVQLAALNGISSQTESARICGTSRANVSKYFNEACDMLCLPRTKSGKSQAARAAYSECQKGERHWRAKRRQQRFSATLAAFATTLTKKETNDRISASNGTP